MAFLARLANDRDCCSARFPSGTARRLIQYWWPGELELFSPDEIPPQAFLDSDRKTVTDIMAIHAKLGFCPEARDAVEALEPGVHQFFPVQILRSPRARRPIYRLDGRVLETPYYLLNPGVRLDAVDLERSDVDIRVFPQHTLVSVKPARWEDVVLRRSVIAGHHIWRGRYQLGMYTFFSDTLVELCRKHKWRGMRFKHIPEV